MALVRVGPKRQITIPRVVSSRLCLEPGDLVEVQAKGGQVLLTPKRVVDRAPAPSLIHVEQRLLNSADTKTRRIRAGVRGSKGLTDDEVAVAVKAGLIPDDQAWWWHERWQRREREAEHDLRAGKATRYRTAESLIRELHDAAQVRRRA